MAINEQVYGSRDNWIVPGSRTELGYQYSGDVYYYGDIASDDNLKIKVANFNTLSNPVTSFRSQIDDEYPNENYTIRNNWRPTQTESIDKSIVQFGIGPQSGLADIEWWGINWVTGQPEPTSGVDPVIINHDKYDIVNIGFGLNNAYIPPMNYTTSQASNTTTGDMLITGMQYLNRQIWGDQRCAFSTDSSSFYKYHIASGYAYLNFITQIPVKNLKIYPRITAYKSDTQWKQFNSIQDYLTEKNDFPLLGCVEAIFQYRTGSNNTTDYNTSVSITPIFTDKTTVCKGYHNGSGDNEIIRDNNLWYCRNWRKHFVVAGRYGYDSSGTYGMMNDIYWVATYDSRPYTYAIFDAVYQTPDFKFTLDANKCITCDVSSMTDNQITEGIRTQLASFGLFFVDGVNDLNLALDDDKTFLGILRNGVGYGDYSSGSKNREQQQWNWDSMEENNYDPDTPPEPLDPNIYDTASQLNTPSRCASGTKYYVLNAAGVENLVGELWKAQENIPSDTSYMDYNNEQYLSNNPIDMIVSCKRFPLIPLKASESEPLVLGQYQTNVQGYVLSDTTTWINLGSKLIYKHFKNYLDYQTKIVLYIPFCGMINLDPSVWMGQTVNAYMAVDYITGSCTAYLIRDSDKVIYATAEGNCSVDLPVTGLQAATIESQLLRSKSSLDSSKLMIGAKILGGVTAFAIAATTGGAGAAAAPAVIGGVTTIASTISDAYKINQLNYDLHHTEAPVQQIGSSSPLNAWSGELECRLYVYYPAVDPDVDDAAYAHSIGNATVQQGTIGSFGSSGEYAVITNADLSDINCTDSEKTMISNALTSGVYL